MVKIYRTTDKITIKIDSIVFKVSPLSFEQKSIIQSSLIGGDTMAIVKAAKDAIKYAVKDISGVQNMDGSAYELEFDGEVLSDSCVDDLLNIDQHDKLSLVCTTLLNGIPKEFSDPQTGEKIKGITIERSASRKKK